MVPISSEKKNKFAWLIAGSENYIPGIRAFLNSMIAHKHKDDVILIGFKLPESFINWLSNLPLNIRLVKVDEGDQIKETAIRRFKTAVEYGKDYEAICLMDADMFLVCNCNLFFEIASKEFIVTGSNGMVINFNTAYQKKYKIDLGQPEYIYTKVHTTAPIFLSPKDLDWFQKLYDSKRVDHFDDFLYLNILGIKMDKHKRMLVLPPYLFTGIHHFGVKPETGWFRKEGVMLTGTEEQAYIIHGKWWDKGWTSDLMLVMSKYFKDNNMGTKCVQKTQNSIKVAYEEFCRYNK